MVALIDAIVATHSWDALTIDHHEYATGILLNSAELKMSIILLKWKHFSTCQHVCCFYLITDFFHVNAAIFKLYLDFKKLKLICPQITLVHSFLKSNQCIEFLYWKKCSLHVSWSLICVKSNYKQFLITSLPNPF